MRFVAEMVPKQQVLFLMKEREGGGVAHGQQYIGILAGVKCTLCCLGHNILKLAKWPIVNKIDPSGRFFRPITQTPITQAVLARVEVR